MEAEVVQFGPHFERKKAESAASAERAIHEDLIRKDLKTRGRFKTIDEYLAYLSARMQSFDALGQIPSMQELGAFSLAQIEYNASLLLRHGDPEVRKKANAIIDQVGLARDADTTERGSVS